VFLVEGIDRTKVFDEGRTDVEVPPLKFPGQTVAGYDLTVDTPELSGLKSTIPEIVIVKIARAAITL
jgi:hypothetical protein